MFSLWILSHFTAEIAASPRLSANVATKGFCYTSAILCHAGGYQVDKITTLANRRAIIFHSITDNRRADCVSNYRDLTRFDEI